MISLKVNGKMHSLDISPDVPLVWVIREHLKLTGTKYSCGKGLCGSCTVHLDGKAVRSCQTSAGEAQGKSITTIEGVPEGHPLKKAWVKEQVAQCGFCQPGQIMQAAELLSQGKNLSEAKIIKAMDGNLCRCGTYPRIKTAIKVAAKEGGK
ncbi:MAG: (2Fe-2S)-binding protein [Nitrospirae bacterium]|nr:(2Fe-2S)-binding protein [Nitrospirota bacterium]